MYYLVSIILSLAVSYFLRDVVVHINYDSYKELLSSLLNISSIVFAVIGAWIAIIYPKVVSGIFKLDSEVTDSIEDTKHLANLIEISLISSIVLIFILCIHLIFPVGKEFIPLDYRIISKQLLFFTLVSLTFMQILSVIFVVKANYSFLGKLREKNKDDQVDHYHDR